MNFHTCFKVNIGSNNESHSFSGFSKHRSSTHSWLHISFKTYWANSDKLGTVVSEQFPLLKSKMVENIISMNQGSTDGMQCDYSYPKSKDILSAELLKISLVPSIWLIDSSPDILLEWLGVWWPDGDFFSKIPGRTAVASPTKVIAYKIHQVLATLLRRSPLKWSRLQLLWGRQWKLLHRFYDASQPEGDDRSSVWCTTLRRYDWPSDEEMCLMKKRVIRKFTNEVLRNERHVPTEYSPGWGISLVLNKRSNKWHVSLAPASASASASRRPFKINETIIYHLEFETKDEFQDKPQRNIAYTFVMLCRKKYRNSETSFWRFQFH